MQLSAGSLSQSHEMPFLLKAWCGRVASLARLQFAAGKQDQQGHEPQGYGVSC